MEHPLEKVFSWLEAGADADYREGVLLLQQHSGNRNLVNNLLKKESQANAEKLRYELIKVGCGGRMEDVSEVLNHFAQAVQGAVPAVQQVADVLTAQDFPAEPAPEPVPAHVLGQVDDLTQLMAKVYNERVQLSNSLAELDPAEGPRVVGEILTLQNQYNALAQKRRNVVASPPPAPPTVASQLGIAPDQAAPFTQVVDQAVEALAGEAAPGTAVAPAPDRAELVKQRNTLRSNISKAKKKALEAKTEEKRSEYEQKAGKLEVELSVLNMQLAQPQA
jgi:hypothetical protein